MRHDLYTKLDKGVPDAIKDRNGEVVLSMCKRCGRGEADLGPVCVVSEAEHFQIEAALQLGFKILNDDADIYLCTEGQLLEFARRIAKHAKANP